jgi:hypothetical protein
VVVQVDREQTRRTAERAAHYGTFYRIGFIEGAAHNCLALLDELEQAEARLNREQRAADIESEALTLRYQSAEARADRLAWRLRRIKANAEAWHGPPQDSAQERALAHVAERIGEALAEYEGSQPKEDT